MIGKRTKKSKEGDDRIVRKFPNSNKRSLHMTHNNDPIEGQNNS